MNRFKQMVVANRHGIVGVYNAMRASQQAGVPFYVMCAFLEKESYGGRNVFGHDGGPNGWYSGAGRVTKKKYLDYKRGRQAGKGMQGVGPMQLTWWEFQDRADARGGCWKHYVNCLVGAELINTYWNRYGNWKDVGTRYNGSPEYGEDLVLKIRKWKSRLS